MIKIGDTVKMSEALKVKFIGPCAEEHQKWDEEFEFCLACSKEHIEEFGDCIGVVEQFTSWNDWTDEKFVDVRWQPSNLRYSYEIVDLELVE